jgi:acyl-CoA thioester hydrolase
MMTPIIYTLNVTALPEHIDYNNHVNNLVYFKWMHTISNTHWKAVTTPEMQAQCLWLIGQQSIQYLHEIKLNENIIIETYVEKTEKQKSFRVITFYNFDKSKIMAKANIMHILLNTQSRKPMRIGADIISLFETAD